MNPQSYLVKLFLCIVLVCLIVLGLNFTVDPYGITGFARLPNFNEYKTEINNYTKLSKKYQPLQRNHNALIVGNSRVELGINPSHFCFDKVGWDVYNIGVPGASVRAQLQYALNVIYQQPVKHVLLSLDFTDFLSNKKSFKSLPAMPLQTSGELKYLASGRPNPDFFKVKALDYYKSLFSLDALIGSLKTIAAQSEYATDRDEAGFNPARDYARAVLIEGPAALFEQKLQELEKNYSQSWYLRNESGELDPAFKDLVAFLDVAVEKDIGVILFTNPFHESYWSLMKKQDLMPLYADWKQSIETLVEPYLSSRILFWNFSLDSPYIVEKIPAVGVKREALRWFWEPAHYREELGSLMVDAMLSESCDVEVKFGSQGF